MVKLNGVAKIAPPLLAAGCLTAFGCGSQPPSSPVFLIDHVDESQATYNRKQFRSVREDTRLSLSLNLADETRRTIAPPLPSRLSFEEQIPAEGVLRFAIALNPLGDSKFWPPVEFRVLAETDGQTETLFAETLNRTQAGSWLDREVDLAKWEGRRLHLTLETKVDRPRERVLSTARRVMPLWGNPVLSSPNHQRERPNVILVSIDCLRADHVGAYGYERNNNVAHRRPGR